jgi:hypothetical protein
MSYGITPVAVVLSQVEQAFGCGHNNLVRQIIEEFGYRFNQDHPDPDNEEEPTLEQALHEVINGTPLREKYGHKYGYVMEMLCVHFGEELPNQCFWGMRSSWIEKVDNGLTTAGVPEEQLRLNRHLTCRGSPIPIPEPDDFPSIGYLLATEIGPALGALEAANLDTLDPKVREAISEIKLWMEVCARSSCDLMCFYY